MNKGLKFVPDADFDIYELFGCMAENSRHCRFKQFFASKDVGDDSQFSNSIASGPFGTWRAISTWNPGVSSDSNLERYLSLTDAQLVAPIEAEYLNKGHISKDVRVLVGLRNDRSILSPRQIRGISFVF